MNILTITEIKEGSNDVERLSVTLDDISPAQIQQVLAVLYRAPRKPRSDKGKGKEVA